ncbi:MAG: radical SAM protein [Nitrospiraceae bacterium]|nr:MAG: radical SAM protein [Nitrospiraceae bacterium]
MHKQTSKRKIQVGLVQVGERFGNEYYLPYSIGLLQAYARKYLPLPDEYNFHLPVYKRISVESAADRLSNCDIVFFSSYLWNHNINLKIAGALKNRKTDVVIVFGGPMVPEAPDAAEKFLRDHLFIDLICYGEGEVPFLKILENVQQKAWEKAPSAGFINKENHYVHNPRSERIKDIDEIPSPYLEGVFDALLKAYPEERWSALLETNRGCPYTCAYCYWGKKTRSRVYQFGKERIFREIDWISRNKIKFVFCCDANFGMLERDREIAEKVAANKKLYGCPEAFSVQNTKNSTKKIFEMQKLFNDSGLQKGVNLALQSLNEMTLKSIDRSNISNEVYRDLQKMFTENNIPTFSDLIIGLPDETYDSFTRGVSGLIESGQHNRIQFINLTILENTGMADREYQERYGFVLADSRLVPHHTSLDEKGERDEFQKLVVGTNTMPEEDWIKTRVFCWMISLLYFNKLLQLPFLLLNSLYLVSIRELTGIFIKGLDECGKLSEIASFFTRKAVDIQKGGSEHIASEEWLNLWWPADEYMFIKLCAGGGLNEFYREAEFVLSRFVKEKGLEMPDGLLHEAIWTNKDLIKQPFTETDLEVAAHFNILEIYHGKLNGADIPLTEGLVNYIIDRTSDRWSSLDDWLREVVWYGSKRGAYHYNILLSCRGNFCGSAAPVRRPDSGKEKVKI